MRNLFRIAKPKKLPFLNWYCIVNTTLTIRNFNIWIECALPGGVRTQFRNCREAGDCVIPVSCGEFCGATMEKSESESVSGVKSVSQAINILNVVAQMNGPVSLKEIAAKAGVAPSKAHRYLQSLCACGFLSQTAKSGAYDLGMETLRLGLAAINRVDIVNRAGEALLGLTEQTNADGFLTVWADSGPTIVRFERSRQPTMAMLGAGVSIPVLTSATGLVFLAFGNSVRVEDVVRRQTKDNFDAAMKEVSAKVEEVRKAGYANSFGVIMPGRQCIAAPIMSYDDKVIAAVSLVSLERDIINPDSQTVTAMLDFCKRYSVRKRGYAEETLIEKRIAV